jgi:inner membrane protein
MDPITQGVVGAAAAQAVARRRSIPWAGLLGALSGMAPDLDVLVRSTNDPLLFLEYHRQFSHSLIFIPMGALLCAALSYPLVRRKLAFRQAFVYCLIGYATHGLLDCSTSYGTQLFWPFSDLRVAWNIVSVVDPLFTLPLLLLVALASRRRAQGFARLACVWALLYLAVGLGQRERAESFGHHLAEQRGHRPENIEAKPAFGNLLLWKTIYESDEHYHVDAVRLGLHPASFPGEHAPKLDLPRDLPWLRRQTQQARDLERFRWYSAGYLAIDPARADRVIDVRYSMVPNRIEALWGIQLDPGAPDDEHAAFFTSRRPSPAHRAQFIEMLFGGVGGRASHDTSSAHPPLQR